MDMLHIDPQYLPAVIINFLVVAFVVGKLVFKPTLKAINKRKSSVDDAVNKVNEAEEQLKEMESQKNLLEQDLNERKKLIREEINEYYEDYKAELLRKADDEILAMKEEARQDIEKQRRYTAENYKQDFIDISCLMTEKILNRSLDEEEQKYSIDSFLEALDEISAERLSGVDAQPVSQSLRK